MSTSPHDQEDRSYQWICLLLLFVALAGIAGRMMSVRSKDQRTPFFSANDRSRVGTISSLVDYGTYEIDRVMRRRGWDSIDKVRHVGKDGEMHFYSSKPPLFPTMIAWQYWAVKQVTGATLERQTFYVARIILLITNLIPLVLFFWLFWKLVDEIAETEWGKIFAIASAGFGTFLTTFAVSINNHLPAAICVLVAIYGLHRIYQTRDNPGFTKFFLVGLAAAFCAANELPALSFFACVSGLCFLLSIRGFLIGFVPGAAIVVAGFFSTNLAAHDSWKPPYAHREPGQDWYDYEGSYWFGEKKGVDKGEPSKLVYAANVLVGHYGIFSLTPIWLLSFAGIVFWIRRGPTEFKYFALLVLFLTLVCLTFYIGLRPLKDRNYGGVSCGFRWMFWFIPMWLIVLIPMADWASEKKWRQGVAMAFLAVSIFSANYGASNPWVSPWIYEYWKTIGWIS